jgi:hypothetical protein
MTEDFIPEERLEPYLLQAGSRSIAVDCEPLAFGKGGPSIRDRIIAAVASIVLVVAVFAGCLYLEDIGVLPGDPRYALLAVVLLVVLSVWGLNVYIKLAAPKILFGSEELVWGPPWSRRKSALSLVIAVQAIRVVNVSNESPAKGKPPLHELNLVLDHPDKPRLPFTRGKDWPPLRNSAAYLAKSLEIPLLEHTYVIGSPT